MPWPPIEARSTLRRASEPGLGSVIALHCSGADASQWRKLTAAFGSGTGVHAPDLIGSGGRDHWAGARAFSLMDEAQSIIDMVDESAERVHLVGHSYGGAVALKVAQARCDRIASLSLYEPSAFRLLKLLDLRAAKELEEIEDLATAVSIGLISGTYQAAAQTFVEYWSGEAGWHALRPSARDRMIRWLPKAALDFRALLFDDASLVNYCSIACPVLLLRGEHAPRPSRLIVEALAELMPCARIEVLAEAGHMGPITHADLVSGLIVDHIRSAAQVRASP
jgi:pimeloyl-ACP methyl ester carboxylesterase